VLNRKGKGAAHPATDAGAPEDDRTSTADQLPDKTSTPKVQAAADRFAAELIHYGDISDRLPVLQRVDRALASATSVDQVKHIHDVAVAMAAYARQADDRDREADVAEIRMKAVRRLGEMIQAQKATVGLAKGAREPGTKRGTTRVIGKPASLTEAGIGKNLAHQARTLAKMPKPAFEQAVQEKRQAVVARTTKPVTTRPSAQPKRVTHLDLLELWTRLPTEERRRFFDGIGLRSILESIPEAWTVSLERWVDDRRQQSKPTATANPDIPADLSIPDCLRRPTPTKEGTS
jgi:hypothetical protein